MFHYGSGLAYGLDKHFEMCYTLPSDGGRCPEWGAEGERDVVLKLSGKRTTVSKASGETSA